MQGGPADGEGESLPRLVEAAAEFAGCRRGRPPAGGTCDKKP